MIERRGLKKRKNGCLSRKGEEEETQEGVERGETRGEVESLSTRRRFCEGEGRA